MKDVEIQKLKDEVAELRIIVADTTRALELLSGSTKDHFATTYQYINDIHDYLFPVVHKVFPGFAEDKEKIDDLMGGRRSPSKGRKAP